MSQTQEVRGVATSIRSEGGFTHVRYHATDVVSFSDKEIILRTGGWFSVTTKLRMNQAANQFDLGFVVGSDKGEWKVSTLPFDAPGARMFRFRGNTLRLRRNADGTMERVEDGRRGYKRSPLTALQEQVRRARGGDAPVKAQRF